MIFANISFAFNHLILSAKICKNLLQLFCRMDQKPTLAIIYFTGISKFRLSQNNSSQNDFNYFDSNYLDFV
jgi:hypothetical protein